MLISNDLKQKMSILQDIVCHNASISQASRKYDIKPFLIKEVLNDVFKEDIKRVFTHQEGVVIHDLEHKYVDFNNAYPLVGSARRPEIGLSDFECIPEFAQKYADVDILAFNQKSKVSDTIPVFHHFYDWIDCHGDVYPIYDDRGEPRGTVVFCSMDVRFNCLSFETILKILISGQGSILIKKNMYSLNLRDCSLNFSPREAECLLYLLIGLPIKVISSHMKVSPKTVEKMITVMNQRVGTSTTFSLIKELDSRLFFEQY